MLLLIFADIQEHLSAIDNYFVVKEVYIGFA